MADNLAPKTDHTELRLAALELAVTQIQERNCRVETDKAWETSLTRRILIALLTYLITSCVFWTLAIPNPFSNALIPLAGYLISTLTIPWIRACWSSARARQEAFELTS